MTGCVCKFAGWCERHQLTKVGRLYELCQNDQRYFDAWENGAGPLQEKVGGIRKKNRRLGVGTILQRKIKEYGYAESGGCGCQSMVAKMNHWGVDKCRENITEIVIHLEQAAIKTGWLERMAVTVPLVKSLARCAIKALVEEAINEAQNQANNENCVTEQSHGDQN